VRTYFCTACIITETFRRGVLVPDSRPLRVFLCHASQDKPAVRELYKRLKAEAWIYPWLDEDELLPGQDWDLEIYKAIREADAIIVCLSKESVTKEGYVQKEFKRALSLAEEKPVGTIFIIPLRLDDCEPPLKFLQYQWLDYFSAGSYDKLVKSLRIRYDSLIPEHSYSPKTVISKFDDSLDLYRFIRVDSPSINHPIWLAKYPVTNAQYERFLKSNDYTDSKYWMGFPRFDDDCHLIGDCGDDGLNWLKEQLKNYESFPGEMWRVQPRSWNNPEFGILKAENPVVGVTWYEANAYCKWLMMNWDSLIEFQANPSLKDSVILRLPLEIEWVVAAGGDKPEDRYPWDLPGRETSGEIEVLKHANIAFKKGYTTSVMKHGSGKSPFGIMDMVGNVWEWQANYSDKALDTMALRGGSWHSSTRQGRLSARYGDFPIETNDEIGFRVVIVTQ